MNHSDRQKEVDQNSCALEEGLGSLTRANGTETLALILALVGVAGVCELRQKTKDTIEIQPTTLSDPQ